MTELALNVQEKAALFCTKTFAQKPSHIRESLKDNTLELHFHRRNSWTLEELFVSSILLVFVILISSVSYFIAFSRFESVAAGILAFSLAFIPLFYLDFIWLFSSISIHVNATGISKLQHHGIFKREHHISITDIQGFEDDAILLADGHWRVISQRQTNLYLVYRIAFFLADIKNTK